MVSPFFQFGVLCRRSWLALAALRYLKQVRLLVAHFLLFLRCSLHSSFQLLDKESNPYGETPYRTLDKMARRFRILSDDCLYDLGSGRGLGLFWWRQQVGCRVYGVDNCSIFIKHARRVQAQVKIEGVIFIEGDFLQVDLSKATVIYLYGTALSDEMIMRLIERFETLDRSVKIITVTYSLAEYSDQFRVIDSFTALMPWGRTEIFLNQKR